jgi:hypothetical protein
VSSTRPTRRRGWRIALDGALLTALPVLAILGLSGSNGPRTEPASVTIAERDRDAARFYADLQAALGPFLRHAREIPVMLGAVVDDPVPDRPDLAALAATWQGTIDEAKRNLDAASPRLGSDGRYVNDLVDSALTLYREAAATAERIGTGPADDRGPSARSALRMLTLGDRLFDAGRRVLYRGGALFPEAMGYPADVPDFPAEGLDPHAPGPRRPGGSGFGATTVPTVTPEEWVRLRGTDMTAAATLLEHRSAAGALDEVSARHAGELSRQLAEPVPAGGLGRPAVAVVRLALLVGAESHWAGGSQLGTLAARLRGTASDMLAEDGVRLP